MVYDVLLTGRAFPAMCSQPEPATEVEEQKALFVTISLMTSTRRDRF